MSAFTLDSLCIANAKRIERMLSSCEPLCGQLDKAKLLLLRSHYCCSCSGAAAGATIMYICVSVYVCKCLWVFRWGWQRVFSRADFAYFPRLLHAFSPPPALLLFVALSVSVFCRPCAQLSARFALRVSHANINKHTHTQVEYEHSFGF